WRRPALCERRHQAGAGRARGNYWRQSVCADWRYGRYLDSRETTTGNGAADGKASGAGRTAIESRNRSQRSRSRVEVSDRYIGLLAYKKDERLCRQCQRSEVETKLAPSAGLQM